MLESAATLFIPRQVTMLNSRTQEEDNKTVAAAAPPAAPEKKGKKKKKRSSEALEDAPQAAGTLELDAPNVKAREALLSSISAFLQTNGFSKTLAVFRSEAQLPIDGGKTSVPNLENLVCKFLESSSEDVIIDLQKEQDSEKVGMQKMDESENNLVAPEHTHRNKKTNSEDKNLTKSKISGDEADFKKSVPAEDPHVKTKDKKKKKKSAVVSLGENHSVGSHGMANTDPENDFQDHLVDEKKTRKKKQKASSPPPDGKSELADNVKFRELVEENVEELKSLSSTPPAESNSKQKHEKRKKTKKSSEEPGKENVSVVEETTDDLKISKKRKRSASEERASLRENAVETNNSKHARIEGTEDKKEIGTHQNSDRSIPDNENLPINKKRKKEKNKDDSTQTVKASTNKQLNVLADSNEDLGASDSQKESKEHQLANGDLEKAGGASSKTMKKEKSSSETPTNAFRRVKLEEVKFVDERLQNNSYWAKDGADSGYGAKAQEILGQVRGRDFRHEKTKKKRGSYRGGQIDLQSHSVKFNYSDEE